MTPLVTKTDRNGWARSISPASKVKLIASIVAISAIELLKAFVNVSAYTTEQLAWKVGIHAVLISSGVLPTALMDKIAEGTSHSKSTRH